METAEKPSVRAIAEAASDAADSVLAALPHSASASTDEELLSAISVVSDLGRVAQTAMAVMAEEVATRSARVQGTETLATRHGQKDAAGLLQFIGRISLAAAKRFLDVGDAIADRDTLTGAPLPPRWEHLAEAAFTGQLESEAAAPLIRQLEDVKHRTDPEMLDAAEEGMARIASTGTPEYAKQEMRVWKEALDADGALPREEAQRRARFFRIGREDGDGMTPVRGLLTPDAAAHLKAATSTFTNPRSRPAFVPADEPLLVDGDELPLGVSRQDLDPRTRDQKLHDVVDGLITAGHQAATRGAAGGNGSDDAAGGGRRSMTQLIATITLDDLRRGTGAAWVNGMTEPVGPVSVERILCDQGYRTMLFGDSGEALWLGSKREMFTPAQKLAIAARDTTCDWPGCDCPADWCEVHHVYYRRDGGKTDIDNGILLCSAHHHMVHSYDWDIQMRGGVPYLIPPAFLNRDRTPIKLGRNRTRRVEQLRRSTLTRDGDKRARDGTGGADPPEPS